MTIFLTWQLRETLDNISVAELLSPFWFQICGKYNDIKSNPRDLWPETWLLRHWLFFWQLRTTILTITLWPLKKERWWQHSQFLRCLHVIQHVWSSLNFASHAFCILPIVNRSTQVLEVDTTRWPSSLLRGMSTPSCHTGPFIHVSDILAKQSRRNTTDKSAPLNGIQILQGCPLRTAPWRIRGRRRQQSVKKNWCF